jgi:hypothetical protein
MEATKSCFKIAWNLLYRQFFLLKSAWRFQQAEDKPFVAPMRCAVDSKMVERNL